MNLPSIKSIPRHLGGEQDWQTIAHQGKPRRRCAADDDQQRHLARASTTARRRHVPGLTKHVTIPSRIATLIAAMT
jgi:hypothetical protein